MDDVCERTLIDPIPSPPIARRNSNRKMHILSLRHAVSFVTFLDMSETDLCHSTASNASLFSVYSSIVEQLNTEKHSAKVERHNLKFRAMSLSYKKAIAFIRRLFNKPRQDQSL